MVSTIYDLSIYILIKLFNLLNLHLFVEKSICKVFLEVISYSYAHMSTKILTLLFGNFFTPAKHVIVSNQTF